MGTACLSPRCIYIHGTHIDVQSSTLALPATSTHRVLTFPEYYHFRTPPPRHHSAEETMIMFHHFEYVGTDFEADMKMLDNDPTIKFWWTHCEPCQEPFQWTGPPPSQGGTGGEGGAWWAPMKCLNHCGGWPTAWSKSWPDPDFVTNNPDQQRSGLTDLDGLKHNRPEGVGQK